MNLFLLTLSAYQFSEINLDWDFGSDMYIVKDGVPASLLQNPVAFRDFVTPLPPRVKKVQFLWRNNGGQQVSIYIWFVQLIMVFAYFQS